MTDITEAQNGPSPAIEKVQQNTSEIIVSTIVVVGFISILVLLILRPFSVEEKVVSILQVLVGTLAAKFGDVVQFHIGSSAGSKAKDATIAATAGK